MSFLTVNPTFWNISRYRDELNLLNRSNLINIPTAPASSSDSKVGLILFSDQIEKFIPPQHTKGDQKPGIRDWSESLIVGTQEDLNFLSTRLRRPGIIKRTARRMVSKEFRFCVFSEFLDYKAHNYQQIMLLEEK